MKSMKTALKKNMKAVHSMKSMKKAMKKSITQKAMKKAVKAVHSMKSMKKAMKKSIKVKSMTKKATKQNMKSTPTKKATIAKKKKATAAKTKKKMEMLGALPIMDFALLKPHHIRELIQQLHPGALQQQASRSRAVVCCPRPRQEMSLLGRGWHSMTADEVTKQNTNKDSHQQEI